MVVAQECLKEVWPIVLQAVFQPKAALNQLVTIAKHVQ